MQQLLQVGGAAREGGQTRVGAGGGGVRGRGDGVLGEGSGIGSTQQCGMGTGAAGNVLRLA